MVGEERTLRRNRSGHGVAGPLEGHRQSIAAAREHEPSVRGNGFFQD
jgi:hypothetical protein